MIRPNGGTGIFGRLACTFTIAAFAALLTTAEASAQQIGTAHAGSDVFSIHLHGGGYFSGSTFGTDGSRFDDTGALGLTATFWAMPNVGLRANGMWYNPDVAPGPEEALLAGENPDVFQYSADVLLRMPMTIGENLSWYPYVLGGIGGKTYDFDTRGDATDFAGNVGAGLELRFGMDGRWGVFTEVRDFISNFDRFGLDETLHDVIWTGGLSFSF
jgi:hypothetical protein